MLFDFVLSTERILNLELQTSYSESAIQCTLENQDLLQEDNSLVCDEPIQSGSIVVEYYNTALRFVKVVTTAKAVPSRHQNLLLCHSGHRLHM